MSLALLQFGGERKRNVLRITAGLLLLVSAVAIGSTPGAAEPHTCDDDYDPIGLDDCEDDDDLYTNNGVSAEDTTEEITGRQVENGNAVETVASFTMIFSPVDEIVQSNTDDDDCGHSWQDTCPA